ncbi:MAG: hypothetical protein FWE24_04810 [Defluviitaleaceae bacterium]|nr:hypothetical protein [Defluviitaleaceae bacterium]
MNFLWDSSLAAVFSYDIFRRMLSNIPISYNEFLIACDLLTRIGIPYDVSFVPGTRKEAASFQLTIHINPTRTEVLVVALEPGSTVFTPSP